MLVVAHADPTRRMRTALPGTGIIDNTAAAVAVLTPLGSVTGRAGTRIGARFDGVARREAGPMRARPPRIIEAGARRQQRRGGAVTSGAESLAVTARAHFCRRRSATTVVVHEITVVGEMALWQCAIFAQIDVARGAAPAIAICLMIVAAKAGCHRRPQALTAARDSVVAVHAVALPGSTVTSMAEPHVHLGFHRSGSEPRIAVATGARARIMRPGMAGEAIGVIGKMQDCGIAAAIAAAVVAAV
jgi:hypothetical protein